jgi:hypothetical protein
MAMNDLTIPGKPAFSGPPGAGLPVEAPKASMSDRLLDLQRKAEEAGRAKPAQTILLALAAGFVLGKLLHLAFGGARKARAAKHEHEHAERHAMPTAAQAAILAALLKHREKQEHRERKATKRFERAARH